jgi:predicted molibdopterin-dependent oxidoreductase YjgC
LRHFSPYVLTWKDFLARGEAGDFDAAWITGGYKSSWIETEDANRLANLETLVVQDCFESPLWNIATIQLPSATFAEREGSFVNFANRLQSFKWAVRPPEGVMREGHLYWRLLGMPALYNARQVLDELAREVPYFSAAAQAVGELGVALTVPENVTA